MSRTDKAEMPDEQIAPSRLQRAAALILAECEDLLGCAPSATTMRLHQIAEELQHIESRL